MSIIEGLLNQKIDYIYSVTRDGYGDVTRSEIYNSVPCRWQETLNRVLNIDGEEVTTTIEVWLPPAYSDIAFTWEFKKDGLIHGLINYSKKYGLDGALDHIKVYMI